MTTWQRRLSPSRGRGRSWASADESRESVKLRAETSSTHAAKHHGAASRDEREGGGARTRWPVGLDTMHAGCRRRRQRRQRHGTTNKSRPGGASTSNAWSNGQWWAARSFDRPRHCVTGKRSMLTVTTRREVMRVPSSSLRRGSERRQERRPGGRLSWFDASSERATTVSCTMVLVIGSVGVVVITRSLAGSGAVDTVGAGASATVGDVDDGARFRQCIAVDARPRRRGLFRVTLALRHLGGGGAARLSVADSLADQVDARHGGRVRGTTWGGACARGRACAHGRSPERPEDPARS